MFFGYENEQTLREENPVIAEHLVRVAKPVTRVISTEGKHCIGSRDGKMFHYADGSADEGQTVAGYRAEYGGRVYQW